MQDAYSRLKWVLEQQGLNTADLVRRVAEQGDRINAKSLYRLADPEEPLEKVDMHVIAAICQALHVGIGDLLTFDEPDIIERFPNERQARMDSLMARLNHPEIALQPAEMHELQSLVEDAELIARGNANRLANRRRRLLRAGKSRPTPTAIIDPNKE